MKTKKKHIVVATPLRLISHLENGVINLNAVKLFVLDEVDHLLGVGFDFQIKQIRDYLPKDHSYQTAVVSATINKRVMEMSALRPGYVSVATVTKEEDITNSTLTQEYMIVEPKSYAETVLGLLKECTKTPGEGTLVFCPTARVATYMQKLAEANGMPSSQMSGRANQNERFASFNAMREAGGLVFASSLLARGVDISTIRTVIQLFPCPASEYVHKAGRTGRMGRDGRAIIVLMEKEAKIFLENLKRKYNISPKRVQFPSAFAVKYPALRDEGFSLYTVCSAMRTLVGAYASLGKEWKEISSNLDLDALMDIRKNLFNIDGVPFMKGLQRSKLPKHCKTQILAYRENLVMEMEEEADKRTPEEQQVRKEQRKGRKKERKGQKQQSKEIPKQQQEQNMQL